MSEGEELIEEVYEFLKSGEVPGEKEFVCMMGELPGGHACDHPGVLGVTPTHTPNMTYFFCTHHLAMYVELLHRQMGKLMAVHLLEEILKGLKGDE